MMVRWISLVPPAMLQECFSEIAWEMRAPSSLSSLHNTEPTPSTACETCTLTSASLALSSLLTEPRTPGSEPALICSTRDLEKSSVCCSTT